MKWIVIIETSEPDHETLGAFGPFDSKAAAEAFEVDHDNPEDDEYATVVPLQKQH